MHLHILRNTIQGVFNLGVSLLFVLVALCVYMPSSAEATHTCVFNGNTAAYDACISNPANQHGSGGSGGGGTGGTGGGGTGGSGGGGTGGEGTPGQIVNPLKSRTIEQFLLAIIDIVLIFLLPLIIFFIIYGGFLLTTARGDTGQIEKGRNTLTWAVIGGVIVLGARTIIDIIQGTVDTL